MTEHQPELLPNPTAAPSPEDQARRASARARLAELLKDPQFRAIEGFPIGSDEDILALSDPPFYTACPNPFLPEIIAEWQQEREALRGIQAVTLPVSDLIEAIKSGGLPCTREELLARFKGFLDGKMRGHDASNTRLTLNQ